MKGFIIGFIIAGIIALFWSSNLRSDVREMRKMKDSLIVENAKQENVIKTQAKCVETSKASIESLNATVATKCATVNANTASIKSLNKQLIASQTECKQIKARLQKKRSKRTTRKAYKKQSTGLSLQQKINIRKKIYAIKRQIKVHQNAARSAKYMMLSGKAMEGEKKKKHSKEKDADFFDTGSKGNSKRSHKAQRRENIKKYHLQKVKELEKEKAELVKQLNNIK